MKIFSCLCCWKCWHTFRKLNVLISRVFVSFLSKSLARTCVLKAFSGSFTFLFSKLSREAGFVVIFLFKAFTRMGAFSSFVFKAFMKIGVLRGFYWNWGFFSEPLREPEFLVAFFWKLLWAQNFLLVCHVLEGLIRCDVCRFYWYFYMFFSQIFHKH